ncbi:protein SCAR3 isoform X2 [Olea europaea var. sylvestris]|uniref:protein SCAR3 isoform X2 n=1 Tax=Olea europaea var. sylvestris TaxID=158386 RepID=UPI000C1D500B|nr:protein SCAR3 isoform X2 [Olea europaea var. sylvestris]
MPLVRVEVRNEYGLGAPVLYREANEEDPKEVLDGVAVSGLLGILRQLGDLAEFAAEVFHGLQEELMITSSRSHKLMARVQHIEAALSPVEKAVLAQRSHLHYAYTAGSNWHPRIRCHRNHFVYSEMPQFIMDSYEDCHGLPPLYLLDKFDLGGPGSCLKRYSDPTFFKRASAGAGEARTEKIQKDKKGRRIQRKGSWARSRKVSRDASFFNHSGRMQFSQPSVDGKTSPFQTVPTFDATLKSDMGEQSNLDSRNESGYIEHVFCPTYSMQPEELESKESFSSPLNNQSYSLDYEFLKEKGADAVDDSQINLSEAQTGRTSPSVTWDEKADILEPKAEEFDSDENLESSCTNFDLDTQTGGAVSFGTASKMEVQLCNHDVPTSKPGDIQVDDFERDGAVNFGSVDQMDVQLWNHNVPMSKPGDIQLGDIEGDGTVKFGSVDQMDVQLWNHNVPMSKPGDIQLGDIEGDGTVKFGSVDQMDVQLCNHDVPTTKPGDIRIDDIEEDEAVNFGSVDQIVVQFLNHEVPSLKPGDIQLDEIESETDHYMDALNSMESEPETDIDCTTKQEVLHSNTLNDKKIDDGSFGIVMQHSDCHSSNFESNFMDNGSLNGHNAISVSLDTPPAASCYTDEVTEEDKFNSISSENNACLPSAEMDSKSLETGLPQNVDDSDREIVFSKVSSSNSGDDNSGMPMSTLESQKPPPESSNVTSVKFWTNGGLLGLEPSKPPDFSVLNALAQDSVAERNAKNRTFSQSNNFGGDGDKGKPDQRENAPAVKWGSDMGCSTSFQDYQENDFSLRERSCKYSPADINAKATTACQENNRSSSRMFEIGVYEHNNSQKFGYQTFPGTTKCLFGGKSLTRSPSSSPPLEHMKISFQPIDACETSKLKLKFRDGNSSCESSKDTFHLFQLVPEPSIERYSVGLDSDDDSFYKSSPSVSDDCLSHHSEMNSEQWESGESPRSKDRDLYDALRRISLSESVSTTLEIGNVQGHTPKNSTLPNTYIENGVENSQPECLFDLPCLESVNHSIKEEQRKNSLKNSLPEPPTPPPLPPLQWRVMNPHSDDVEYGPVAAIQAPNHAFDLKLSASTIPRQPKPSPVDQDQIIEAENVLKSTHLELQKLNGGSEANQAVNGLSVDEKDNFLQQIRTKSFSLKPTVTSKPLFQTGGPANGKVTAILEKANAIRQVVRSDDGEDDNWSNP